jgi:hypothetical protein
MAYHITRSTGLLIKIPTIILKEDAQTPGYKLPGKYFGHKKTWSSGTKKPGHRAQKNLVIKTRLFVSTLNSELKMSGLKFQYRCQNWSGRRDSNSRP